MENKPYGVIYKTTNLVNNKTYIGQSTKSGNRLKYYMGSGKLLLKAIKKYGLINFEKEIIIKCKDKEQLDQMERLFIKLLKPDYNIENGGSSVGKHSEETKKKISESHKGLIASKETKLKLSESHKNYKCTQERRNNLSKALKGKIVSEETKKKMKMNNYKVKKCRCIETNTDYYSISDASRSTGISKYFISLCCNNLDKSIRGLHWEFI